MIYSTSNKISMRRHYALLQGVRKEGGDIFLAYGYGNILKEIYDVFKNLKIKLAILIAPPFWQIEPTYHQTCKALQIPDCIKSIYDLPLAVKLIKDFKMEAVVTTSKIFNALIPLLKNDQAAINSIRLWYFLGELFPETAKDVNSFCSKAKIFQHYAPFSPIPVGYQCRYLSGRLNHFHPSQQKNIKVELSSINEILITIGRPLLKPLNHHPTNNYGEFYEQVCRCGQKQIFRVNV